MILCDEKNSHIYMVINESDAFSIEDLAVDHSLYKKRTLLIDEGSFFDLAKKIYFPVPEEGGLYTYSSFSTLTSLGTTLKYPVFFGWDIQVTKKLSDKLSDKK